MVLCIQRARRAEAELLAGGGRREAAGGVGGLARHRRRDRLAWELVPDFLVHMVLLCVGNIMWYHVCGG